MKLNEISEILSGPATRYRRNMLIVCVIILALRFFPEVDYSNLNLFGLKPSKDPAQAESVVWIVLGLFFVYQAGAFLAYSTADFRNWYRAEFWHQIRDWRLLFNIVPAVGSSYLPMVKMNVTKLEVKHHSDGSRTLIQHYPDKTSGEVFTLGSDVVYAFRRKFVIFWTIEFGGPALLAFFSLFILARRAIELWPQTP